MSLRLGLCGWTIGQAEYFRRWQVLEVQQTFYEPPKNAVLRRWRTQAPLRFEFTLKAWQLVTHDGTSPTYRRMKRPLTAEERATCGSFRDSPIVREAWERTLECTRLLRATAILLQCPASFRPTPENVERLRHFAAIAERPEGVRLLWEPRGPWPAETVASLCADGDLVHVVDPFVDETVTPEQTYFRLHGVTGARHVYTDAELDELHAMVLATGDASPYVMFNNIPRVGDAERFAAKL